MSVLSSVFVPLAQRGTTQSPTGVQIGMWGNMARDLGTIAWEPGNAVRDTCIHVVLFAQVAGIWRRREFVWALRKCL